MVAERGQRLGAGTEGLVLGAVLSASLAVLNWAGMVELAGILAGAFTAVVCLSLFTRSHGVMPPPRAAVLPYGMVLGLVVVIRGLPLLGIPVSALVLTIWGVRFSPLASPGLALVATAVVLGCGKPIEGILKAAVRRAYGPVLSLGGFTVMAQTMVVGGLIGAVTQTVPTSNVYELTSIAPLLGMLSGYLTGSNVGGNALMMTMQSSVGTNAGMPLLFAAIQNSAAGHAVFSSMPVVLMVSALSNGTREEESALVRYGLLMAVMVAALVVMTSLGFVHLDIRVS